MARFGVEKDEWRAGFSTGWRHCALSASDKFERIVKLDTKASRDTRVRVDVLWCDICEVLTYLGVATGIDHAVELLSSVEPYGSTDAFELRLKRTAPMSVFRRVLDQATVNV